MGNGRKVPDCSVLECDGWVCQICGVKTLKELRGFIHSQAPEVGHIIPVCLGGSYEPDNLRCECRTCNSFKGDLTDKELLAQLMQRVADERLTLRPIRHQRMSDAMRASGKKLGRPSFGFFPIQISEAVKKFGSIASAAKSLGISYALVYSLYRKSLKIKVA